MGPKIKALDEQFKDTLDKYSTESKTPILEVKCEKDDPMNIRKY